MEPVINRAHKDRLFKLVFNADNEAFELYCAIRNVNGELREANLEFDTIEDAIYMSTKNDLSFCCFNDMNFFEQQSTFNANEPLRLVIYYGQVVGAYVKAKEIDIFSSAREPQRIPNPRTYVIYCGGSREKGVQELKLSDAFFDKEGDIEVKVHMYNICAENDAEIDALLSKSPSLKGYAYFVKSVRRRKNGGESIEDAINHTIDDCIGKGYLVEVLKKHRTEVFDVVLTEYNEEEHIRHEKELSLIEGRLEMLVDMVYSHDIPLDRAREKAAAESNCDRAKFDSLLSSRYPDFVFPS